MQRREGRRRGYTNRCMPGDNIPKAELDDGEQHREKGLPQPTVRQSNKSESVHRPCRHGHQHQRGGGHSQQHVLANIRKRTQGPREGLVRECEDDDEAREAARDWRVPHRVRKGHGEAECQQHHDQRARHRQQQAQPPRHGYLCHRLQRGNGNLQRKDSRE